MTVANGFSASLASLTDPKTGRPRCCWPAFCGGVSGLAGETGGGWGGGRGRGGEASWRMTARRVAHGRQSQRSQSTGGWRPDVMVTPHSIPPGYTTTNIAVTTNHLLHTGNILSGNTQATHLGVGTTNDAGAVRDRLLSVEGTLLRQYVVLACM